MILIFGFRTPAASEIPTVLYLGDDGDEALRICEKTLFPRVARLDNPLLRKFKDWTEEESAAFEKSKAAKKLDDPVVANVHPHLEPGAVVYGSEGYMLKLDSFVSVPKAKELIASGYSKEDAEVIISRQQAMYDAYEADDTLSHQALVEIANAVAPAPAFPEPKPKQEKPAADEEQGDETEENADGLGDMTVEELKALAADKEIETPGCKLKKDFVDTIRLYREIDKANDVASIRVLAQSEEIDLTDLRFKRDVVNAIVAKRRAKAVQ